MLTDKDLKNLFKEHWRKAKSSRGSSDERVLFERLYDAFEVLLNLSFGINKSQKEYFEALKNKNHVFSVAFGNLVAQEHSGRHFRETLVNLKKFSPVENNQRDTDVNIEDETDFNTIIEVIRVVRNNLRHGVKEYSQRSEELIKNCNVILFEIIENARPFIINEENDKVKISTPGFNNELSRSSVVSILLTILFFGFIFWFFLGPLFIGFDDIEKCPSYPVPNGAPCEF